MEVVFTVWRLFSQCGCCFHSIEVVFTVWRLFSQCGGCLHSVEVVLLHDVVECRQGHAAVGYFLLNMWLSVGKGMLL